MQMADGGRRLVSQRTRMVRNTVPHRNLDRRKGGERTRVDCGLWRLLRNLVPLCLSHAGREVRCAAQCSAGPGIGIGIRICQSLLSSVVPSTSLPYRIAHTLYCSVLLYTTITICHPVSYVFYLAHSYDVPLSLILLCPKVSRVPTNSPILPHPVYDFAIHSLSSSL